MLPYQLKCSESGLELTCAGRLEPRVPWTRASELLPLRDVTQPLVWAHIAKPPLHGSIKNAEKAQHSLNKVINLANVKPFTSGKEGRLRHRRNEELKYRIGLDINDPYGRESWYSGSCIKVEGDLVFFTGNDGFLRVSRMAEDDRGVFDDTPGIEVKIPHRKLDFERILSLYTSEETSSGSYHVAARRRHGLSVYSVTEADQVKRRKLFDGYFLTYFIISGEAGAQPTLQPGRGRQLLAGRGPRDSERQLRARHLGPRVRVSRE